MQGMPRYVRNPQGLSLKQTKWIKGIVEDGMNGTQSALNAYDTDDPVVAKSISSENMSKPYVKEALEKALASAGLDLTQISSNFARIANHVPEKISADSVLKANVEVAKLLDLYPNKKSGHLRVTAKIKDMTFNEAQEALKALNSETVDIMADTS